MTKCATNYEWTVCATFKLGSNDVTGKLHLLIGIIIIIIIIIITITDLYRGTFRSEDTEALDADVHADVIAYISSERF